MEEKKPPAKRSAARPRARTSSAGETQKPAASPKRARASTATKATRPKRTSLPAPPERLDPNAARRERTKQIAIAVALAALDKKAERVEIVDLGDRVDYADYLVVMTGRSDRQVVAIAQGIEEALDAKGIKTKGREGVSQGHWVLIDVDDVIVHVFLDEARRYYDLEGLWMDAPRVPTPSFVPPQSSNARDGSP